MKRTLFALVLAVISATLSLAAQTATITVTRTGGTAAVGATSVRQYYTLTAPVDANNDGIPESLTNRVLAGTFTGNNPTTIVGAGVPVGSRVWVTWTAVNSAGLEGPYMRPVVVDLTPPGAIDGVLNVNVTLSISFNQGGTPTATVASSSATFTPTP